MGKLRLEVLSPAEIENIHTRTLDVLEQVGVRVLDAECRRVLAQAGARLDEASDTVRLPRQLVMEQIAKAPAMIECWRQDGQTYRVGGESRIYGSLVTDPWIIDYETQRPRRLVLADMARHTRLGDAHPAIQFLHRMDMPPMDVDPKTAYVKSLEVFVTNTSKHLLSLPSSVESTDDWLEVVDLLADARGLAGRPILSFGVAVTSPLTFTGVNAYVLKQGVKRGYPILMVTCTMAGTTAPLTFAGGLLVANAENLFLLTMAQLLRAGAPFIYASGQSETDLRTGYDVYYPPDKMLWKVANVQMGKSYGLPISGEIAGSMVGRYDIQGGIESALLMLPSIACGQNMGAFGTCYNAVGMSAEFIVIQADTAHLLERISAGMDTSEAMLGFDSIAAVGPGGYFLEDPLTLRMLRGGEFYSGGSFDRLGEHSPNDPKDSMLARAHERVEKLLATHTPDVPAKAVEAIAGWARRKEATLR